MARTQNPNLEILMMAVDHAYNEPADLYSIGRSILVGLAVESIYKKLVTDNPDVGHKMIIGAIAGGFNCYFCLSDAYDKCSRNRDIWFGRSNKMLSQCLKIKRQYDDVDYRLKINEPHLAAMEKQLQTYQARQQQIMESGTRRGGA